MVDPYDLKASAEAVDRAWAAEETSVIVTTRPCALLKNVQKERAGMKCFVDEERCVLCGACLKLGCPAISKRDGRIVIDQEACNGCGLCVQVCPKSAVGKKGES